MQLGYTNKDNGKDSDTSATDPYIQHAGSGHILPGTKQHLLVAQSARSIWDNLFLLLLLYVELVLERLRDPVRPPLQQLAPQPRVVALVLMLPKRTACYEPMKI